LENNTRARNKTRKHRHKVHVSN